MLALSFAAGVITILSPCVLPALPLVVGSALHQHRHGPFALAAGLILSFVSVGMLVSTVGAGLGLNETIFRYIAAAILLAFGVILLSGRLQSRLAGSTAPLADWANRILAIRSFSGLRGQFLVGALLGAIWSPCSGPTLGAAIGMAAQSGSELHAAAIMTSFGIGASFPMLMIGYGAQSMLARRREQLLRFGLAAKTTLGFVLVVVAVAILMGVDKRIEALLLETLPTGWVDLITRF